MRKLISFLCAIVMFGTVFSVTASAENKQFASLTITYKANDVVFDDIDVQAYQIADVLGSSYFTLVDPFDDYPISVRGKETQQEWNDLATTLIGYIQADDLVADSMFATDENGVVVMDFLNPGLYLVMGITVQKDHTVYQFDPFFAYMPHRDSNGDLIYDVEMIPKWSSYIPQTEYSVVKLWKDIDNVEKRPQQVEVEIYKDNALWGTEVLNSSNNWKYSWQADADASVWSVVEKDVPEGYSVSVSENNGEFSIINTYKEDKPVQPDEPSQPQVPDKPNKKDEPGKVEKPTDNTTPITAVKPINTGDMSQMYMYAVILCIAGLALIVLGIYRNKKK